jgi:dipeptidyl aminopeptidase/acylaminoacyl peptidase
MYLAVECRAIGPAGLYSHIAQHCWEHWIWHRVYCPYVATIPHFPIVEDIELTRPGIYRSWGGAPFRDLERLLQSLQDVPYLDWDRAAVAAASYGAYMISWMNGHDIIKKFSAAVWHDGIFNLPSFFMQTDFQTGGPDFNGAPFPWVNHVDLERWNPARPELLKNWKNAPPTLVVHSEKDYRCPMTEGIATFQTLQAHGVPSRFLTFPDENHFVLKPENALVWQTNVIEWLNKYTKRTE